ncbi:MAG: zf-HC2 domain-containing protein [Anaerolineae bacterium]|nr:zf-HC2 domain-containing protein [Thermoflexales bacterium]MDW8407625.1 zf-HC2 domain-containing protein [Anaerolineae bacterium]
MNDSFQTADAPRRTEPNSSLHAHDHAQCRQLLASLSDYVDGDLAEEICAEIERHMAGCERCRIVVDTLRKTVELYHTLSEPPAALPTDVRQRLFFRLDLEPYLGHKESPA